MPYAKPPASMTSACGPTMQFGFPVTAPSSLPSSPSSTSPRTAGSPMNWPTFFMLRSKIPSTIWCAPTACAGPRWPDDFFTPSADGRQARGQLRTRQTAQSVPLLTDASALQVSPDELKAAILLFYSLLESSSCVACLLGWNPSSWVTEAIGVLAEFLGLTCTPSLCGRQQQLLDQNVSTERTPPALAAAA